jgi:hypothetical protein
MSKTKRYKFSCCVIDAENLVENRDFPIKSFSTFLHPLELTKSNHKKLIQCQKKRTQFVDIGKIEY